MSNNINRAVNLTSYLITLPPATHIVIAMLAFGLAFGFAINVGNARPLEASILDGLVLLALPALITSVVVKLMARKMPYRRIAATALGGEIVYCIAYAAGTLLVGVNPFLAQFVVLVGAALVFVFWYVIARFVFILKYRSILFAIIQLILYLTFLASDQALHVTNGPLMDMAPKFFIAAFILLGALLIFFFIINAPMKKNLGLSSTDAVSLFFSQWLYHNKDLEKAFDQVGEPVKTVLSIMGFKRKSDTVFFVTPCVHFGPFGNLGGSEFSYLIAEEMDRKHGSKTFVFHGTVTHDLNPVSSSQISNVLGAVDDALEKAAYTEAKISLALGDEKECRAQALVINDAAMVGLSRAPEVTEDINFGLGLALMGEAERHVATSMVVDQHNAETGEITSFEPGSLAGFGYMNAIRDALTKKSAKKPLKVGVAFRSVESTVMGKAGIKVAVFSTSPEYVIVLLDSNGVTPQFRDRLESEVKETGKKLGREFVAGIYTTDTHQTNMVRGVLNPLKEEGETLAAVRSACEDAFADMQEAKFFADKRWFDIRVLGARQSIEVISTVNSIVAVAKITLPLVFIGSILLLLAIATRL